MPRVNAPAAGCATTNTPAALFPSVAAHSYCTNCGADLITNAEFCGSCGARVTGAITPVAASVTNPRRRYKAVGIDTIAVPWPLVFLGAAIGIVLLASLVYVLLDDYNKGDIAVHNTTDAFLCFNYAGPECPEIKPRATSHHWLGDCYGSGPVTIYTPRGREIYSEFANCDAWQGASVVIVERNGVYIVADTIDARAEPPLPD